MTGVETKQSFSEMLFLYNYVPIKYYATGKIYLSVQALDGNAMCLRRGCKEKFEKRTETFKQKDPYCIALQLLIFGAERNRNTAF